MMELDSRAAKSPVRNHKVDKLRNSLPNLHEPILLKSLSQPELVRRSFSTITPLDYKISSGNNLVNSLPQEFVLVDGKKYRINRSPKAAFSNGAGNPDNIFNSDQKVGTETYVPLKRALDNANSIIARQSSQILKQVRQIERLTQQLNQDNFSESVIEKRVMFFEGHKTEEPSSIASSRSGSGLTARRRAEAIESGQKLTVLTPMDTPAMKHAASDIIKRTRSLPSSKISDYDMCTINLLDSPRNGRADLVRPESDYMTPPNGETFQDDNTTCIGVKTIVPSISPTVLSEVSFSPLRMLRKLRTSKGTPVGGGAERALESSPASEQLTPIHDMPISASAKPPKGLAARLSMGSRDRSKVAPVKRRMLSVPVRTANVHSDNLSQEEGSLTARTIESEAPESILKPDCTFKWKAGGSSNSNVHLFIAHDNPQVGNTVAAHLRTEGSMHVIIETKEKSGLICFILASIVYSGNIECVEGVELEKPRGSQFIVCSRMTAMKTDVSTLPKRANGDIMEIDLQFAMQQCLVDISTDPLLTSYLQQCIDRVDVILDPSHTQMWYPYFEGRRKMAPQFRSQGVGYIRLGDEFSNYGSAFLSLNAGVTYLDNGATSIVADDDNDNSPIVLRTFPGGLLQNCDTDCSPKSHKSGIGARAQAGVLRKPKPSAGILELINLDDIAQLLSSSISSTKTNESICLPKELDDVNDALQLLSDAELKWSDRVEALRRLHGAVINISNINPGLSDGSSKFSSSIPSNILVEISSALILCITKQMNPHVLRSAVCCVRVLGAFAACTPSCGVTWRILLLETVHLLRSSSKPVYEEAKDTLVGLQSGAACAARWTVCMQTLHPMLMDIFAGPKKGSVACNSSKVVLWLVNMVTNEIDCYVDYLIRKSDGSEIPKLCDRADIGAIFMKCYQHLLHREEITREAAVGATGALLVYDILQTSGASDGVGWGGVCALSGCLVGASPKGPIAPVRTSLNAKEDSSSTVQQSPTEILLVAALSAGCAAAVGDLARDVRRMHDRVLSSAIKLLESKVKEGKASIEKKLAERLFSLSTNDCLDDDTIDASEDGIAFRRDENKHSEKKDPKSDDIFSESVTDNMFNELNETNPSAVNIDDGTDREKEKLISDWFVLRMLLRQIPVNEDMWNVLCVVVMSFSEFYSDLTTTATSVGLTKVSLLNLLSPQGVGVGVGANCANPPCINTPTPSSPHGVESLSSSGELLRIQVPGLCQKTAESLRDRAQAIRKLIKVKMASDSDLQLAMDSAKTLNQFCFDFECYVSSTNKPLTELLQELEEKI